MTDLANVELFDLKSPPAPPRERVDEWAPSSSAREFRFTVEGEPVPKLQGTILKLGKHMSIKAHPRTRAYEDIVRQRATKQWCSPLLTEVAITMTLRFYRPIPKSFSRRDHAAAVAGLTRPLTKPDCSNYLKAFEDGMKGVIFADDALIVSVRVDKFYAERPRVEVELTW